VFSQLPRQWVQLVDDGEDLRIVFFPPAELSLPARQQLTSWTVNWAWDHLENASFIRPAAKLDSAWLAVSSTHCCRSLRSCCLRSLLLAGYSAMSPRYFFFPKLQQIVILLPGSFVSGSFWNDHEQTLLKTFGLSRHVWDVFTVFCFVGLPMSTLGL